VSAPLSADLARALAQLRRRAQWREASILFALGLAPALAEAWLLLRVSGKTTAAIFIGVALVALAVAAWRSARRFDQHWLARRLDARVSAFEDSTALALAFEAPAAGLQQLQQARIRSRLTAAAARAELPDLRPAYPRRGFVISAAITSVLLLLALFWPRMVHVDAPSEAATAAPAGGGQAAAIAVTLTITPPAYTGLAEQTVRTLDAKAPVGSRVRWVLHPDAAVASAALVFHDGSRVPLTRDGATWRGEYNLAASALYRVELDGAPTQDHLSRLDAIPDQPPEIKAVAPEKTLTIVETPLKTWDFAFEARDDYGLGAAELSVTLTQGSGEQIKVTEQKIALGEGGGRSRTYRKTLDLAALHFEKGDDLIVRLAVADNRTPQPNIANSASFILRWLPDGASDSVGLEGVVQKTLPAYFRSERQIIIDTEALQAQRPALAEARFAKQSDELGVDQKVLRLRYGQFLGEGFESTAEHAPGADAATAGASPALAQVPGESPPAAAPREGFGQDQDTLHEFGHAHDIAEAATLLDPETRRILKLALNEMWQAELHLRQAQPEAALPYEYKALDYIKQVQQAERIYLARAGLELPQVDLSRRLSGERAGLIDRTPLLPQAATDPVIGAIWDALAAGRAPDTAALADWLRQHPETADPLAVLAAADRLRRDPDCALVNKPCASRSELQARLWPLLPVPAAAVRARPVPDAASAAWLDALTRPPQ